MNILAPAKINLFLHILGRRDDGFHTLESLTCFTDFGDEITIEAAGEMSFEVSGPFGDHFSGQELDTSAGSQNIIFKTIHAIAKYAQKTPAFKVHLEKNLPIAAGLGGGSADAAAIAKWLCGQWELDGDAHDFQDLLLDIGADVPACFYSGHVIMRGIGDRLGKAPEMPNIPIVLVNPLQSCPTSAIFKAYEQDFRTPIDFPDQFSSIEELSTFLSLQNNDLQSAAIKTLPVINDILEEISLCENVFLTRMSGSGATCFGIFGNQDSAIQATQKIKDNHENWWVKDAMIPASD